MESDQFLTLLVMTHASKLAKRRDMAEETKQAERTAWKRKRKEKCKCGG